MFEHDLYRTLSRNLPGFGIFIYDHSFRFISAIGEDVLKTFGLTESNVVGKLAHEIHFPAPISKLEEYFQAGIEGEIKDIEIEHHARTVKLRFAPIKCETGCVTAGLLTVHDITDMARARDTLQSLSIKDELTGIYNRRGFMLLAGQQAKNASRSGTGSLLFFVDLNDLKVVNDNIGHQAGDECLKEAAAVLTSTFRETDIVARYGGDEFVVFVNEAPKEFEAVIRGRMQEAIDLFNSKPRKYRLSFAVGCAYYDPADPKTLDELVLEADQRMYDRKRDRRKNGSRGSIPPIRATMPSVPAAMLAKAK